MNKKVFSKDEIRVLDVHYPIAGSIQSFCSRSNVVYDSVYIYYGEPMMEIKFATNRRGIHKLTWSTNGIRLDSESYFESGRLKKKSIIAVKQGENTVFDLFSGELQ